MLLALGALLIVAQPLKGIRVQSAFAVRQLQIGLASVLSILVGATATIYGVALLDDRTFAIDARGGT